MLNPGEMLSRSEDIKPIAEAFDWGIGVEAGFCVVVYLRTRDPFGISTFFNFAQLLHFDPNLANIIRSSIN